ncbi:hypothetical protein SAMN05216228_10935 [Rhizobium tibeticum]|uniref:Transposase n=1 Tax=Rhizobium tibeticum TaxID=501024 RepID=A0A1H8X3V7_9HYPH|nr:hypothetical protein RTCCBAU85039_6808 [Rhizobium tibeticum]SEP34028.1 hypothetical protein SAMN05216228_10935 [Rhizobium tibeticum]
MIEKSRSDYCADLDRAIEAERALHGQKPLKEKSREPQVKETKVSRTDPDSGYMVRDGKPKAFLYLDHRTVDGKLAIITDTHVTLPMSTTVSSIATGWTASVSGSASRSAQLAWMPAMRRPVSPRVLKIAPSSGSPAIAIRPRQKTA